MTTKHSPLGKLKVQANQIAMALKRAERGESISSAAHAYAGKISDARSTKDTVTFGVVMDDKLLKIEMPWATIRETSEAGIAEYILNHMREARDVVQ